MAFKNSKIYSVAVFMIDRAFGGHEEGGWYYTYGEPDEEFEQFTRYFTDENEAYIYRDKLEKKLISKLNEGRPSISSVVSRGRYSARLEEGEPKAFPSHRPHYE